MSEPLKKLLDDIVALKNNTTVYETWCGNCEGVLPCMPKDGEEALGPCSCGDPTPIYVGYDPLCWDAIAELEDLIKRAQPFLADMLGVKR